MNIFVANLFFGIDSDRLRDIFSPYGNVSSAKVIMDKETGRSKGFGFVEMDDAGEAQNAIQHLNGTTVDGKELVVKESQPQEGKQRSGGGGGRPYQPRNNGGGGNRGGYGGGGNYRGGNNDNNNERTRYSPRNYRGEE